MLIEYKASGNRREVDAGCGKRLVKAGIAKRVYKTRQMKAKEDGAPASGYERRDLKAEG